MRSKDVLRGMKVVPIAKSIGNASFERIKEIMAQSHLKFLYVSTWNKDEKCWWLGTHRFQEDNRWLFTAKEFKPYKENENEV